MTRPTGTPLSSRPTNSPSTNPNSSPDFGVSRSQRRSNDIDFAAIQDSAEFQQLRSRLRRFVFPISVLFLAWYFAYVLLAAYAHDFMSQKVLGEINVGLVLGLLQFVTTMTLVVLYVRYARKNIDPRVDELRERAGDHQK